MSYKGVVSSSLFLQVSDIFISLQYIHTPHLARSCWPVLGESKYRFNE